MKININSKNIIDGVIRALIIALIIGMVNVYVKTHSVPALWRKCGAQDKKIETLINKVGELTGRHLQ